MANWDWENIWANVSKYMPNKYLLTCIIFAVVLTFCGEQSYINRIRRNHALRERSEVLREYQELRDKTRQDKESLTQSPDNLERIAREKYHMHADNEDVYLIKEE